MIFKVIDIVSNIQVGCNQIFFTKISEGGFTTIVMNKTEYWAVIRVLAPQEPVTGAKKSLWDNTSLSFGDHSSKKVDPNIFYRKNKYLNLLIQMLFTSIFHQFHWAGYVMITSLLFYIRTYLVTFLMALVWLLAKSGFFCM